MEPEYKELQRDWPPATIKPGKPYSVLCMIRDIVSVILLGFLWFLLVLGFEHYDLVKINEIHAITLQ